MPQCFDSWKNEYVYCSSHVGAYVAVGIIVPVGILIIVILIAAYRQYRLKRFRREQQQMSMTTIVPIYNTDEQQQAPYNYSYPPHYTAVTDRLSDKPPSYEQTVQQISETNPTSRDAAAVLPVTTITSSSLSQPVHPQRNPV